MKLVSTIVILTYLLPALAGGATVPAPSAFLAPVGQHYRYSDLVTTPKGTKNESARLSLTTSSEHDVHAHALLSDKWSLVAE